MLIYIHMNSKILTEFLESPKKEYFLSILLSLTLLFIYVFPSKDLNQTTIYIAWVIAIIGGIPVLISSFRSIQQKRITIELFNLFVLFVALFLASPVAAIWIELMLTFASYLEWKTKSRASNAVMELLNLAPEFAHVEVENDKYEDIPQKEIVVGNIILIKEGERVPADGKIIFGSCIVDESSFTGESIPQEKNIEDEVFEATTIIKGVIKIKATKVGSETVLGRMVALMQAALTQKSIVHKFADKFAELFLPISAIIGTIIYLTTRDMTLVAAFLLVICADDIAVAIPLAMEASLGKAAKRGVIIKGGISLEKLSKVKTIVFDKTGTLTYAKFSIDFVDIENSVPLRQFWKYVAISEKFSEHPIGKEIYKKASTIVGEVEDPESVDVLPGAGIKVNIAGSNIIIGNKLAMDMANIIILDSNIENANKIGKTTLYVSHDNRYLGAIYISDTVKDDARNTIDALHKMNIRTVILTGDHEDIARDIGNKVGISEIRASLSPEKKLEAISEYAKTGVVVMVGDGVNDAPSLARADIGIAMGKLGSAVSVEAADIIIQTDSLSRIPEIIELSKMTRAVIINNFIIWFISNAIGTTLVLTRIIGIPFAAFYNFATDFIPLINSARLFRNKR